MATAEKEMQEPSIIKSKNKNIALKIIKTLTPTFGSDPLV